MTLLAAFLRDLARLATWSAQVLTDTADDITERQRAQATKDYR